MLNSPDHILSLFELELQPAMLGDTEVGPAVAGLDGGVGEVAGVSPGQTRGHTVVRVTGMVTAGCRLLFPLARQGLGDRATPHQIITGAVHILSEKELERKCHKHFITFRLKKNTPDLSKAQ